MKTKFTATTIALALLALSTINSQVSTTLAQGTAFTYQGQLEYNGSPASGTYNLQFYLYPASSGGSPAEGPVTTNGVVVTNGLFTVLIDFGSSAFTGATNWLQIGVETNGVNTFTTLTPRQQLTPTPYAIYAENAGNLSGTLSASQLTSIGNTNVGATGNFFVGPAGNLAMSGFGNTANGTSALGDNTSGNNNTANGYAALGNNTSGGGNAANGSEALAFNTTGGDNTANGLQALFLNTSGSGNTANGVNALYSNTNGSDNTADGVAALGNNTSGFYNIALGYQAGVNISAGSANIDIGNQGLSTDTNIIRIGTGQTSTYIAGVINGNGGGLTNLNVSAAQLSGTVSNSQLANSSITVNAGAGLSGGGAVALGGSTTLNNAGVLSVTGNADITASTVGGAVTLGDTATSSATAGTLVKRDGSGNFSAGSITAASFSGAFTGNGGGLTNLNASQLTSIGNTNVGSGNNFFVGPSGNSTTSGGGNTANGMAALALNTTGGGNTANGAHALAGNTSGIGNTANGADALAENTSGGGNTASGLDALYFNTNGIYNTANGDDALYNNTSGSFNTADGVSALYSNTSGSNNIALGYQAGFSIYGGSSNIDIGNEGLSTDTNIIRIGSGQTSTFIAGVIQSPVFGGNVGIGTASSQVPLEIVGGNPGNPFPQLWVAAATNAPFGAFLRLDATGIANGKAYHIYSTGSSADEGQGKLCFQDYTDGKTILCLTTNGYVGIDTTSPTNLLQVGSSGSPAYCNGTTWVNGSDRNSKEGFVAIQPVEVLAKVAALPITQWKYKVEKDGAQHLGPMAQDFHAAFGLNGGDDTHIATVDEEGVALAAIQGLNQKVEEQRSQLEQKQTEITELKQRLDKLERIMNAKNGGGE